MYYLMPRSLMMSAEPGSMTVTTKAVTAPVLTNEDVFEESLAMSCAVFLL